jgi:hypothetical protein
MWLIGPFLAGWLADLGWLRGPKLDGFSPFSTKFAFL